MLTWVYIGNPVRPAVSIKVSLGVAIEIQLAQHYQVTGRLKIPVATISPTIWTTWGLETLTESTFHRQGKP